MEGIQQNGTANEGVWSLGWCSFKVSLPVVISTGWARVTYYKNVRVGVPVGFGSAANPTHFKTSAHKVLPSICSLVFSSLLCLSPPQWLILLQTHIFSHFRVKLTFFAHLSQSHLTVDVSYAVLFSSLRLHLFQVWELAAVQVPTTAHGRRKENRRNVCFPPKYTRVVSEGWKHMTLLEKDSSPFYQLIYSAFLI